MRSLVSIGLISALGLSRCPSEAAPAAAQGPSARASARAPAASANLPAPSAPALLYLGEDAGAQELPPPAPSSEPPKAAAARRACRVAALGDSLTDYRSGGGGYLRVLEKRCPESEFVNYGKGGDMLNQMRRRFEAEVLAEPASRFTHLIVFGGVNDLYSDETALRTPAKMQRDLTAVYQAARARGWRVVAITVAPWGGFAKWFTPRRSAATSEINAWIKASPADSVVDAHALLSCGDPERLCAEYSPPFKDGLHFGKKGHEKLGDALYEAEFQRCL